MAEFESVKTEVETLDVKEEYVEEEDPLPMTSNSETGTLMRFNLHWLDSSFSETII